MKRRSIEKSLKNILQEKAIEQRQEKVLKRLERSEKSSLKVIDNESWILKEKLASYGRGMTSLSSYFNKEVSDTDRNTIWFPLQRSSADWEPRPCWLGNAVENSSRCTLFPCRNITSYHFMFRHLPQWVLDAAENSVRNSKIKNINSVTVEATENAREADVSVTSSPLLQRRAKFWNSSNVRLPQMSFPEGMTDQEKKLKILIEKKRILNEIENKPPDRSINYGMPTSVRRLQRPVRPVIRRMDTR